MREPFCVGQGWAPLGGRGGDSDFRDDSQRKEGQENFHLVHAKNSEAAPKPPVDVAVLRTVYRRSTGTVRYR